MTVDVHADLQARWTPTGPQIAAAVVALHESGADFAVVPIALARKEIGFWTPDVEVLPCTFLDGDVVKLAVNSFEDRDGIASYDKVRALAEDAALHLLALRETPGTGSYANIKADGTWAVFESYCTVERYLTRWLEANDRTEPEGTTS
jgi:hypothetical protein